MKDKLKNLLKNKAFIGCTAGVLVLAITLTVILCMPKNRTEIPAEPETPDTSTTDTVPDIDTTDTESETSSPETEETPSDISLDVGGNPSNPDADVQTGGKADAPVNPVVEVTPEKPAETDNGNDNTGGGIIIGNPPVEEKYSCGSANHHCTNAEAHAWILNLELEGCSICGSHSCPSFYATDEWGGATVDYSKCPKYSSTNDPAKYCQVCGRELWSQSNPTGCFSYLQDTQCECGELVKGNTCHHH